MSRWTDRQTDRQTDEPRIRAIVILIHRLSWRVQLDVMNAIGSSYVQLDPHLRNWILICKIGFPYLKLDPHKCNWIPMCVLRQSKAVRSAFDGNANAQFQPFAG